MGGYERVAGFRYLYSEILKQEIALSEKTGRVFCQDKTEYAPEEIVLLDSRNMKLDAGVHNVKKVFGGEIIEILEKVKR
jgi:hypothetical protein